jgi:hypothetical protein
MDTITPAAERLFLGLALHHRESLRRVLREPVLIERCELLETLARYRVRRFGLAGFLRVTFREVGGGQCVLHVGTHAAADRFARRYDGSIPHTTIRIQESMIMKSHSALPVANGQPNNGSTRQSPRQSQNGELASEGDLLVQAVLLIANNAVEQAKRQLVGDIEAMGELVRGQCEQAVSGEIAELLRVEKTHEQSTARQFATVGESIQRFEDAASKTDRLVKDLAALAGDLKSELGKRAATLEDVVTQLTNSLRSLQVAHETLARQCRDHEKSVQQRLADISASQDQFREELGRTVEQRLQTEMWASANVANRLEQIELTLASNGAQADRLDLELRSLKDSVASLSDETDRALRHRKRGGLLSAIMSVFRRNDRARPS